ncbi:Patched Domain-Containing Protein 3 [Manis pentadactyla]|nr:Patched Domain-Containing Protein 3 [Manis pentadactyla]
MTDVEADCVGLDISNTESVRFCLWCDGERKMVYQGYGEACVMSGFKVWFQDHGPGLGLCITESVRFWVRFDGEHKMVDQGYGEAWVTSVVKTLKMMVSVQGECAIQFQEYSEALLIPIVMV